VLIRNVAIDGRTGLDIRIANGVVAAIGERLPRGGADFDGRGGAVMMGLVDHHCHLLASAAQAHSLPLDDVRGLDVLAARLQRAAGSGWLRATGCPAPLAARLDARLLDLWCPTRPVRVLDQTGALWVLNSSALALVNEPLPPCVERDDSGVPTGRVWRGDAWLGTAIGKAQPDLAPTGQALARLGITAVTDPSATTDAVAAALLADAHRSGALPQRLSLMSAGPLEAPCDDAFAVGPVKVLLDDRDLMPLDDFVERIAGARAARRVVAVHCVTDAELALTLAAFEAAGSRLGDRIEHGGMIPSEAIPVVKAMRLTVVTQPGFVDERGDRYLTEVDPRESGDLYRCASLIKASIPVAGSSDSPYAGWDCWRAMRAAVGRRTGKGQLLGDGERVATSAALALYRGAASAPGGPPRRIAVGQPADLFLFDGPVPRTEPELDADRVAATWIAGRLVHETGGTT
jgi:predicted amidohydrolase YtcJ